jgi:uncharacterized protein with HEPN domain
MKDDALYLRHILECIRRIEEHAAAGREEFLASHTLQDATLRNLQTMSEATQRLTDTVKLLRPTIPWSSIAGFRNVLVHNYLGIDLGQVWAVIERDIPPLKEAISFLVANPPQPPSQ